MLARFIVPKPISEDNHIFEDIVCEIMARQLNCRNLQRYGRKGQKQQGVDIAGFTPHGVVGIQCKHHPTSTIRISEIDKEIAKSEKFRPLLTELYIVTSAERDTKANAHVLTVSQKRQQEGTYSVRILFWNELVNWLEGYPDLIYKYFSQFFPTTELETVHIPSLNLEAPKQTMRWKVDPEVLKHAITQTVHDIPIANQYQLSVSLSSFSNTQFNELVDVDIQLSHLFQGENSATLNFNEAADELREFQLLFNDSFFSKEIWIYLSARLSLAFLFGWMFRKVARYSLKIFSGDQVWASNGLPRVFAGLIDDFPIMLRHESEEVVVVLNISRDISSSVYDWISTWQQSPRAILVWNLDTHVVRNAAHALSLAYEICQKLKSIMDRGQITHIHLFGALPAPLATLIGHHLNAICPITIYFLDSNRQEYLAGGTIHNSL